MEDETPEASKLTRSKQRWANEGKFLTGHTARPDTARPDTARPDTERLRPDSTWYATGRCSTWASIRTCPPNAGC